jgi:hypothetical protein
MNSFFVTDLSACEKLWRYYLKTESVSDLWEFRICFHKHFGNSPHFLILEDPQGIAGILPLSIVDETETAVFFPGEMWQGKTWIERTPIYLRDSDLFKDLLSSCPERSLLRYIDFKKEPPSAEMNPDETGYVLYPKRLNYDLTTFKQRFSNKRFKAILKTIESYKNMGCVFHLNRMEDFDIMVDMNIKQFGDQSFMADPRFRESFRDAMEFLYSGKLLRMVSVEIKGAIAAVDLGALYRGIYTVFLGGTHKDFPGIAKLINMYHIESSINERFHKIDFLCGDFHWKKLWHLDPELLYRYASTLTASESDIFVDSLSVSPVSSYQSSFDINP